MDLTPRRRFLASVAQSLLGVSVLPLASRFIRGDEASQKPTAKSVIYLFMSGGMSHLDTFDPKPEKTDIQGPVGSIATKIPGVRFTEYLPQLAGMADRLALVRSLHHTQGNHEPGQYKMRTGYEQRPDLIHPSVGAWSARLAPPRESALPGYVRVGGLAGHPANGFFEVKYAPLPILKAENGLQNGRLREGLSEEAFRRDLDLASTLDADFVQKFDQPRLRAYVDLYDEAIRMMQSEEVLAFDIRKESGETRKAYGEGPFASGCLLARRLVEHGVSFVEVDHGGWDTHVDNHKGVREACVDLDRTLAALLTDLESRGLLETTLVVLATEFGRTPEIDQNAGRNHHPVGYTCLLAGGGVRGGQVYGATDANGDRVADQPVTVLDFNATIGHALGLPLETALAPSPDAQRFSLIGKDTAPDKGKPLVSLFG